MTTLLYALCVILLTWSDHFPGHDAEPIVGGRHDRDNEVIWQVSYQVKDSSGHWEHICGGSIVSNKNIVTAAHCFVVIGKNETEVWNGREETRIIIGTQDLNSLVNPGVEMEIDKVIIPKAYTRLRGKILLMADIAVITLQRLIDLSINRVKYGSIDLFDPKDETERKKYDEQEGFVAGFGATKVKCGSDREKTYVYDDLRNILPVHLTNHRCPKVRGLRCIRYEKKAEGPKGVCCGDSGGPLYYRNGTKFELVGVISTGPRDCDIRTSCSKIAKVTFIPGYMDFLNEAKNLNAKMTFPEMSVGDFEESGVDYIVLPDQAELARNYYVQLIEKKKSNKGHHRKNYM